MSPFGWWRRQSSTDIGTVEWRRAWEAALAAPDAEVVVRLSEQLQALGGAADDLEVEQEMLDGLAALVELSTSMASGLPVLETGHRIVGADVCHFSAPASRADVDGQPSGRLLLTSRRAIFLGGAAALTVPWHTVLESAAVGRDLVLVRRNRDSAAIFRCNSFADALCGRLIAERLTAAHRPLRRV